jgi:Spy/CpxP family protein refolding chaperone
MTKHLWAVVVVVAAATAAQAQQRPVQQPQPLHMVALTNEDLQKELKITDDQKKSLKEVMDKAADLRKKQADARGDQTKMQEVRKEAEALAADAKTVTDKAFTDDQKTRIKQIDVQRKGVAAFTDADVLKELKATDDQKTKLKTVSDDFTKARGDLRKEYGIGGGAGGTPPDADKMAEYNKKAKAMTDETMDKAAKELTDDQKKAWKGMLGEAFDVTKLQPQRRPMN